MNIVKLNIGGTVFHTTRSTLTKYDGYFKAMFESGIPLTTDESGSIFIDRSAKQFDLVLNYLRDGDVPIPDSNFKRELLLKEAEYYMLDGLIALCSETMPEVQNPSGVRFTCEQEVYQKFRRVYENKSSLMISYNQSFWGNIHIDPAVQEFVTKHKDTWNILFFHFGNREFPQYFIQQPNKILVCCFGSSREPMLTAKRFFEEIEQGILNHT